MSGASAEHGMPRHEADFTINRHDGIAISDGRGVRACIERMLASDKAVDIAEMNGSLFTTMRDNINLPPEELAETLDTIKGLRARFGDMLDGSEPMRIFVHSPEFIEFLEATKETLKSEKERLESGAAPKTEVESIVELETKVGAMEDLLDQFTKGNSLYGKSMTMLLVVPKGGIIP